MDSLILKNVRCFSAPEAIPLRKLTILVGENNTGKSTVLAAIRSLWDICRNGGPSFNEEPFNWGNFDQIVHARNSKPSSNDTFELGFRADALTETLEGDSLTTTFTNQKSEAELSRIKLSGAYGAIELEFLDQTAAKFRFRIGTGRSREVFRAPTLAQPLIRMLFRPDDEQPALAMLNALSSLFGVLTSKDCDEFARTLNAVRNAVRAPAFVAFAPVRTQPRRTYDQFESRFSPTGSHIPTVLANMRDSPGEWQTVRTSLRKFGEASGLYRDIDVKQLGSESSSPFQILFKVMGRAVNFVDVGYGVAQSLPLVVEMVRGSPGTVYLIQQPEVHLHPKAQAELATLMGTLAESEDKQFIVETHSDYLIDRLRSDVRDGKTVAPQDLSIVYFEKKSDNVDVFPMSIDASGNLIGAPPSYRRFFLDEEKRFLFPAH